MDNFMRILITLIYALFTIGYINGVTITREMFTNEPCGMDKFRCDEGPCKPLHFRCDKDNDCGDNSDERDCSISLTSMTFRFERIVRVKLLAEKWLLEKADKISFTERFGYYAPRVAVALYLANSTYFYRQNETGRNIAFELGYQFYSKLALRDLNEISSTELASFINSFLVACINPRDFQGLDLVAELRNRVNVNVVEYTNPFVYIALCNAGDIITETDVEKLTSVFGLHLRELWTDVQALAVMALSCAKKKNDSLVIPLDELGQILRLQQNTNGLIDNLKTTALVVQALIASDELIDKYFNSSHAILQLFNAQKSSGSFEDDILKTYFILPIYNYKSLIDINSNHCVSLDKNEDDTLREWMAKTGIKHRIQYSIRLGKDNYLERTLQLVVPEGNTFYKIMQVAANLENNFRFQYTIKSGKPYIYSVFGMEDDPENEKYWFLYRINGEEGKESDSNVTLINKSPDDYIPLQDEHLLLWYRKGPWSMD